LFAVSSDGAEVVNLTNTPDISEHAAHWSPDGSVLALSYQPKTSSNINIAMLDWKTKKVRKLTDEQTKNRRMGWCDLECRWKDHLRRPRQCRLH